MSGRNSPEAKRARLAEAEQKPTVPAHVKPVATTPQKRLTEDGEEVNAFAGRMFEALQKLNSQKNNPTVSEFRRYEPLFRKATKELSVLEHEAHVALSNEFMKRFDPYHKILIWNDARTEVVLEIPRIFTAMKPAESNIYSDIAFSSASRLATLPLAKDHQKAEATLAIQKHMQHAQRTNLDIIREGNAEYQEAVAKYDQRYHPEKVQQQPAQAETVPKIVDDDDCALVD